LMMRDLPRRLWEELNGPTDSGVDAAWLEEIERREREINDGTVNLVPAHQVFAKIEASLKK
jgi:Putative addiction module component